MRLRAGLALACGTVAGAAALAAGVVAHQVVAGRGATELAHQLDEAQARVEGQLARQHVELAGIVSALADPNRPFARTYFDERQKGGGRLPAQAQVWIGDQQRVLRDTFRLSELTLDETGRDARSELRLAPVDGRDELVQTVGAASERGGLRLGVRISQRIGGFGEGVRVLDASGMPKEGGLEPPRGRHRRVPLAQDKTVLGYVELTASTSELARTLRALQLVTGLATALAAAGGVLLGLWLATQIARGLDRRVAEGLRDSKSKLRQAEKIAAWQEIARALAHELKNPLTPIRLSVETLRKAFAAKHASFPELFDESTKTVLDEVKRMEKTVREFAEFARLPRPERQPLALNEVVAGALALYKGAVRVVEELAPGLPPIEADRDQLTQVVLNLVENARDAVALRGTEQTVGRIHVRTRPTPGGVILEVQDNGPGFDETTAAQLFTPYFTTKSQGTGLGLAIAQRIVVEHGGSITAHGTPGEGARFTITLPLRGGVTDTVRVVPAPVRPTP